MLPFKYLKSILEFRFHNRNIYNQYLMIVLSLIRVRILLDSSLIEYKLASYFHRVWVWTQTQRWVIAI